ncbi:MULTISPECIES: hypothetical protein [Bacillus cereus group]|uniref:hypothetical protein n=1 Tax=Bacillus cereus group TaxID=86661 RepID=UPI001C81707A|nr:MULTISPECIES: hypothetical protein [Bacillus cereus group]MDZ4572127.1 hypothetical protein [Bacillus cereus]GIX59957.1 hypothetical protein BPADB04_49870 [Bacillus paranthracis]
MVDVVINFLLNALPKKKFTCEMCQFVFPLPRGDVRGCKKKNDGPYCPKCGDLINNE